MFFMERKELMLKVFVGSILLLITSSHAQELNVSTDKLLYFSGDIGKIFINIGSVKKGEYTLVVEIRSSSGKIIEGFIVDTEFPSYSYVVSDDRYTSQILLKELLHSIYRDNFLREIHFKVRNVESGKYTIVAFLYDNTGKKISSNIHEIEIVNPRIQINLIIFIYLLILIYSIYIMRFKR